MALLDEILIKSDFSKDEIATLLSLTEKDEIEKLFKAAYQKKLERVGNKVFFRGLVEFSNICSRDCFYCGIRKSNYKTKRYFISMEEILRAANFAYEQGYGSLVLQSGERKDETFVKFVEKALKEIKKIGRGALGITLSVGEESEDVYKRWFDAGAHRYLLRIETSNRELYKKIHPSDHSYDDRVDSLNILKKLRYQVGTGVMIGLPGQTIEDLADDVLFFKERGAHMIGMGPYIPHRDAPLARFSSNFNKEKQLLMGLKMIAVTRLVLKNVNIAATTALQALSENGRELGLLAGANVVMPNITDVKYKEFYKLYENKPQTDENSESDRNSFEAGIKSIGEEIGYNQWGDSLKFAEENRDKIVKWKQNGD